MKNGILICAIFLTLLLGGCGDNNKNTDEGVSENKQDAKTSDTQDLKTSDQKIPKTSNQQDLKTSNQQTGQTSKNLEDDDLSSQDDSTNENQQDIKEFIPTSKASSWIEDLIGTYTGITLWDGETWPLTFGPDAVRFHINYRDVGDNKYFIFLVEPFFKPSISERHCTLFKGLPKRRANEGSQHLDFTHTKKTWCSRMGSMEHVDNKMHINISGLSLSHVNPGLFWDTLYPIEDVTKVSDTPPSYEDFMALCPCYIDEELRLDRLRSRIKELK